MNAQSPTTASSRVRSFPLVSLLGRHCPFVSLKRGLDALHDLGDVEVLVEHVEVDAGHAVIQQVQGLIGRVGYAYLVDLLLVVLGLLKLAQEVLGYGSAAHSGDALYLLHVQDGHQARDNGLLYTHGAAPVHAGPFESAGEVVRS